MESKRNLWFLVIVAASLYGQVCCHRRFQRLMMCLNSSPSDKVMKCEERTTIAMYPSIRVNYSPGYNSSVNCSTMQFGFGLKQGLKVKAATEARLCDQRQTCSLSAFNIAAQKITGNSANNAEALYSCMKVENTRSVCDSFSESTTSQKISLALSNPGFSTQDTTLTSNLLCTCNIQTQGMKTDILLHYAHFNTPNSQCAMLEEALELKGVMSQETYSFSTAEDHVGVIHSFKDNQITLSYQASPQGICSGGRFSLQVVRNPHVTITCRSNFLGTSGSIIPQPQTQSTTTSSSSSSSSSTTTTTTTTSSPNPPPFQDSVSTGQGSDHLVYSISGPTDEDEEEHVVTQPESPSGGESTFDFSALFDEEEFQDYLKTFKTGIIVGVVLAVLVLGLVAIVASIFAWKKKIRKQQQTPHAPQTSQTGTTATYTSIIKEISAEPVYEEILEKGDKKPKTENDSHIYLHILDSKVDKNASAKLELTYEDTYTTTGDPEYIDVLE